MTKIPNKKAHCPICGAKEFYRDTRPMKYEYKGQTVTVQQPGMWCDSCGEGIIDGKDSKSTQNELQTFKSKVDGLLTPSQIRDVRKKLHLNQLEAGIIFGGGANAFSRYETGALPAPKPLSLLLEILKDRPELFFKNIRPRFDNHQHNSHY